MHPLKPLRVVEAFTTAINGSAGPALPDLEFDRHATPLPLHQQLSGLSRATGIHGEALYSPRTATMIASGMVLFTKP